jgi:hypothetical protein
VGGAAGVVDTAWGAAEVEGAAREVAEVGEAGDGGAAQGRVVGPPAPVPGAVGPPGLAVGPPAPVSADHPPLFPERFDRLGERSGR